MGEHAGATERDVEVCVFPESMGHSKEQVRQHCLSFSPTKRHHFTQEAEDKFESLMSASNQKELVKSMNPMVSQNIFQVSSARQLAAFAATTCLHESANNGKEGGA